MAPPRDWSVKDVCSWLESLGLGQYRRTFVHHAIDGSLLLDLTMQEIKARSGMGREGCLLQPAVLPAAAGPAVATMHVLRPWGGSWVGCRQARCPCTPSPLQDDVGIRVLGHRRVFLIALERLRQQSQRGACQAGPCTGPAVFQQQELRQLAARRARLRHALGRAVTRREHRMATAQHAQRDADLATADIARLEGQLERLDMALGPVQGQAPGAWPSSLSEPCARLLAEAREPQLPGTAQVCEGGGA